MEPSGPKERLLEAVVGHLYEHGVGETSLRGLAAAIGSSHRMLNYHFGSRRGLLIAVSRAVERQQRDAFIAMLADPDASPMDVMWRMYERLTDPGLHPPERLFFELYAYALREQADTEGFFPEVVEAWIAPLSELFRRLGFQGSDAHDEARLALAASRGMLLDLLATKDRAAVDAAMACFVRRYEQRA